MTIPIQDTLGTQAPSAPIAPPFQGGANPIQSFLGSTSPALPYDLAAAIVARFEAAGLSGPNGFSKIYHDATGENPETPYLIFAIDSGTPELITDASQWNDHRIKFTAYASTQDMANLLRDKVASGASYGGQSLAFASGVMTPFILADRMESRERRRTVGGNLLFKAVVIFQARVRSDF